MKRFFVSTSVYALAHQLGQAGAIEDFKRQLDATDKNSLPVVRTIRRFRALELELVLHVDGGATYIGMARSRAFHEALKSELPWISLDDDIEVTTDCVAAMAAALDDVEPRIVLAPYYTRDNDNPKLTFTVPIVRSETTRNGAKLLLLPKGAGGGFGFVGMNRPAMKAIVDDAGEELSWFDHGEKKLALFYEALEDGLWFGEDTSFFRYRVPARVTVEALLTGSILHAGVRLDLGTI